MCSVNNSFLILDCMLALVRLLFQRYIKPNNLCLIIIQHTRPSRTKLFHSLHSFPIIRKSGLKFSSCEFAVPRKFCEDLEKSHSFSMYAKFSEKN